MPYIKQGMRAHLDGGGRPANAGEMNYVFCQVINRYLADYGLNYQNINNVKGALEGALSEFNRRIVAPYEDEKIAENGDVFVGRYAR